MKSKSSGSFEGLRRGLLALLLVALGGLAGLYLLGRQGAPGKETPVPGMGSKSPSEAAAKAAAQAEDVVASSDAFDYTQSIEGKPVFSVHGDRFRTTKEGKVELEGVRFEVFREAVAYSVASDAATYDSNSQEALLTGNVKLAGSGMKIESGRLQLSRGGKYLSAEGPIALHHGEFWSGTATALTFDVALDLLTMRGPVAISGQPPGADPIAVHARRIVLDRTGRVLRARGKVSASQGASHFESKQAELFLAEDGETPAMLVLEGALTGTYASAREDKPGEVVDFRGANLTVQFGAGGISEPRAMSLAGRGKALAHLQSTAGEVIHSLASRELRMELAEGHPKSAQSTAPVYFEEYRRGVDQPDRTGRADRADAEFGESGGLTRVVLAGGVTLTDPKFRGWGEQALFDLAEGRAELVGEPARTEGESGELAAPHIVYARKTGLLTADRGVRGVLKRAGGTVGAVAGAGFRGDQPVEFQADEAIFADAPRRFLLKGKVRAWQGKNLLLAGQLHGDEAEERLSAAGGVRTLVALQQGARSPAAGPASGTPPVPPPAPMTEVISDLLTYRKSAGTVIYTGGVRLSQGARTLTCDELVAELDGTQQVRRMSGSGKILLRDSTAGRSISGSAAVYDVAAASIELSGDPVTMKDDTGATLSGKRLLYDLASGSAHLAGAAK